MTSTGPKDLRTCRQPGHQAPLEHQHQHDQRHGDGDRGGHHIAPGQLVLAATADQSDGHRHGALGVGECESQREQKLVPGNDESQQTDRHHGRPQHGQEHPEHQRQRAGAVEQGCFLDLHRQVADEGGQHPHRERQRENQVGQHQAQRVVEQTKRPYQLEQPGQHRHLGEHRRGQDGQQQGAAAAKADARQGEGGRQAEQQRQAHHHRGHQQRVQNVAAERLLAEHPQVVAEIERRRPVMDLEDLRAAGERGDHRVIEREQQVHHQHRQQQAEAGALQGATHDRCSDRRVRVSARYATVSRPINRNSSVEAAEP
jgi:hypothetical protein